MRRTEAIVGLVIVLGVILVIGGTLWLAGAELGRRDITVYATFEEIGSLKAGNVVKLRGVPIGRVEDVSLAPGGSGVIVEMSIEEETPFPPDPVALLAPGSLFGDWQVEIAPRRQNPGYAYTEAPDPQILPGFTMPDISQLTQVADEIAEDLAVLTARVEEAFTEETAQNVRLAIENIQQVSAELTNLVRRQESAIGDVTANLDTTITTLNQAAMVIRQAVARVDAVIDEVDEGEVTAIVQNIRQATTQADSLTGVLVASAQDVRSLVADVRGTVGTVEGQAEQRFLEIQATLATADTTLRSVEQLVQNTRTLVNNIQQGQGTLGQLVNDTTLYDELIETNRLLQTLIADIQTNPGKYIDVQVF